MFGLEGILKVGDFGLKILDLFTQKPRIRVLVKWYSSTDFSPGLKGYIVVANVGRSTAQIRRTFLVLQRPEGQPTLYLWWKDEAKSIGVGESIEYFFALDSSMPDEAVVFIDAGVEDFLLKPHYSKPHRDRKRLQRNSL